VERQIRISDLKTRSSPPSRFVAVSHSAVRDQRIRRKLLVWFDQEKRLLPWRRRKNPYRVWVSEVMLQQTTVGAVRDRYEAFLRRFPSLRRLANASEEDVLAAWAGLGYYARARHMHRAARAILRDHGGRLPADPDLLRRLPGFGPYIAGAVAAIAFDRPVAAVEANITRVLARLDAISGRSGEPGFLQTVLERAGELIVENRPGDWTSALMDLGQLVCRPRDPLCASCPIRGECNAYAAGTAARYPLPRSRAPQRRTALAAGIVRWRGKLLLERKNAGWLRGLWVFPHAEASQDGLAKTALQDRLARLLGGSPRLTRPLGCATHTIMNRRYAIRVYGTTLRRRPPGTRFFEPLQLLEIAAPALTRKIARAAGLLG
jgi:A/G-specific adenine glycosylase